MNPVARYNQNGHEFQTESSTVRQQRIEESMPTCCCFATRNGLIIWMILGIFGSMVSMALFIRDQKPLLTISPAIVIYRGMLLWNPCNRKSWRYKNEDFLLVGLDFNSSLLASAILQFVLVILPAFSVDECQKRNLELQLRGKSIDCNQIIQSAKLQYFFVVLIAVLVQAWIFFKLFELIEWAQNQLKSTDSERPDFA